MKFRFFSRRPSPQSEASSSTSTPTPTPPPRARRGERELGDGYRAAPPRGSARAQRAATQLPPVPTAGPMPAFAQRGRTQVSASRRVPNSTPQEPARTRGPRTRSATRARPTQPPSAPHASLRPTFAMRGADSGDFSLDVDQLLGLPPRLGSSVFVSAEEAAEMECNITLASYGELRQPVALRSHGVLHLFEYADFMRHWRERGTNPCTRQDVQLSELFHVRVAATEA